MRISLIGRVRVELDHGEIDESQLLGRQGRLFFAYLVAERARPVPRDELAEALWGETPPVTWEKALTVLASKLRRLLADHGLADPSLLSAAFGCYRLELPEGTWVDVLEAENAADDADRALGDADLEVARARASVAVSLLQRSFLPGEDGAWAESKRRHLADVRERALATLADASLRAGDAAAAANAAEQLIALSPLREDGHRRLMEAHAASGNRAEALAVYQRCRQLLADELGAYPSPETEAIYRTLLELPVSNAAAATTIEPLPAPPARAPRRSDRRKRIVLLAGALLALAGGSVAVAWTSRDEPPSSSPAPEVLPDSLVRIDADSLEPTAVFPIGAGADIVEVAGGYVWVMHHVVGDIGNTTAGDITISRIDPSNGEVRVVGGGLAPCGITPDPSGDLWVANCNSPGVVHPTVVRVDAETLEFERAWAAPSRSAGFIRGLVYGGGSLWVSDIFGESEAPPYRVLQIDPETGARQSFPVSDFATGFGWSEGYGDLWINHFSDGKLSRLHPATDDVETVDDVAVSPVYPVVDRDTVWTGDWYAPRIIRVPAVGPATPEVIELPSEGSQLSYVWDVDAGAGAVWAVTPRLGSLWKIDPETHAVTRVRMPYSPSGVSVDGDAVWVTVRR